MEQIVVEKQIIDQGQSVPQIYVVRDLLPSSELLATGPCPRPAESHPHSRTLFPELIFLFCLSSTNHR
jgi:hypothetical protein